MGLAYGAIYSPNGFYIYRDVDATGLRCDLAHHEWTYNRGTSCEGLT